MCIIDDLTRATQRARNVLSKRHDALTNRQIALLRAIADSDLIQKDISAKIGMDRSTITDVARRLSARGLIRRRRKKDDTRAVVISITEDGRRFLLEADREVAAAEKEILRGIPLAERPTFRAMLKTIAGIEAKHVTSAESAER